MLKPADASLLAAFAAVVRLGSYSRAAAELRVSKSVVSERVRQLEERCGARLLERTTRNVRLTPAGERALDAAVEIDAALARLDERVAEHAREPAGTLRVTTTHDLAAALVAPTVARLVSSHPRVSVNVCATDAVRDLVADGFDVAVRLGAPRESSMVVRRLGWVDEPIVACPELAEHWRHAAQPSDLRGAPWVRHALIPASTLRFAGPNGAVDELVPNVRAEADTGPALIALLVHGAGLGVMPEHAVAEMLVDGRLVRVCPGWIWKRVQLFALTASRVSQVSVSAAFIAALRASLDRQRSGWHLMSQPPDDKSSD
jgi:DNA-binding transcriptional LysR family regulator